MEKNVGSCLDTPMIDRVFDLIETYGYPMFLVVLILGASVVALLPRGVTVAIKQALG